MHHDGAVRQEKGDAGAETGLVVERLPRLGNSNPGRGGNMLQIAGIVAAFGALALARSHSQSDAVAAIMMIAAWILFYFFCHGIAHWAVGRLLGIRFAFYTIGGTGNPEGYPAGMRWVFEHLPFFGVQTNKASMQKASQIPRYDWSSWHNAIGHGLQRDPIFSDYTMRPPGAPAEFGAPSVNLRYALEDHWRVQMGGRFRDGAAPEIHAMCAQLVASPEYSGEEFSTGDEEIDRVSDDDEGTGGPTQWLQWCVSHHIEFVVEQLVPDGA
jgi:hypothetical protein